MAVQTAVIHYFRADTLLATESLWGRATAPAIRALFQEERGEIVKRASVGVARSGEGRDGGAEESRRRRDSKGGDWKGAKRKGGGGGAREEEKKRKQSILSEQESKANRPVLYSRSGQSKCLLRRRQAR